LACAGGCIDDSDNLNNSDSIDTTNFRCKGDMMEREICRVCSGSGEGMRDGTTCTACGGTGEEPVFDDCERGPFDDPQMEEKLLGRIK